MSKGGVKRAFSLYNKETDSTSTEPKTKKRKMINPETYPFRIGDTVLYKNSLNQTLNAKILNINENDGKFYIHYNNLKTWVQPSNITSLLPRLTLKQAKLLKIGDKIDHRDKIGMFAVATILDKKDSNLLIHYEGYSDKYDVWSDYNKELYRFAKQSQISNRLGTEMCYNYKLSE